MTRADEGMAFLLRYENVAWYEDGQVRILDRRIYPIRTEYVVCKRLEEVAKAIADMVTQSGGPYTAAAMGMALAAHEAEGKREKELIDYMEQAAWTLSHARPTTVEKMKRVVEGSMEVVRKAVESGECGAALTRALADHAFQRIDRNYQSYGLVAKHLADQIPQGGTVMTQCFAETIIGSLLKECRARGNEIRMICPETRPYFQGARLTASVACDMGYEREACGSVYLRCGRDHHGWTYCQQGGDVSDRSGCLVLGSALLCNRYAQPGPSRSGVGSH